MQTTIDRTVSPLRAALRFNEANPPRVDLERINRPGCPHHAICTDCGFEAGEHIRRGIMSAPGFRCPTEKEVKSMRTSDPTWN